VSPARRAPTKLACALVANLLAIGAASADEPTLGLDVRSDASASDCADAEILRAKVAERLGHDPFGVAGAGRRLRVRFARSGSAWSADLSLVDAAGAVAGTRSVAREGASCRPLVDDVVFTIVVLVEDLGPSPAPAPPVPTAAPSPASPPHPNEADEGSRATSRDPLRLRFDVAIAGAGALGAAPAPVAGADLHAGIGIGHARLELGGRLFAEGTSEGGVAVRTRLAYGRVAPCYGWDVLAGCFVVALGGVSGEATGAGIASSRPSSAFYAGLGAGAVSRFFLGDIVFVRASLEVLASTSRVGFDVGEQRVWTLPALAGTASLGLGARLR